ncbi:schwannomin-interacting protein 1 homolog isoform X3 [Achroia grisella]|uniref:schwannomin-interacting protein 1 homolog isoform X3 n=1 Tax=Achroia grisella TaxID=688607 RepID=UPI0027D2A300|nr:schwannomin-interacting protein 1 homolog isoform X3 [Achroia grisella]
MKIKQGHNADNGNIATVLRNENFSQRNLDNRSLFVSDNIDANITHSNLHNRRNFQENSNSYHNVSFERTNILENNSLTLAPGSIQQERTIDEELEVCNRQYRINTQNSINFGKLCNKDKTANLEEFSVTSTERFLGDPDAYSNTPLDDERAFDQSDTDEMSENGVQTLPRGIVNPNYPGFQHLAHTLQDYSSNIENFYQSENDMTDDDIDLEITELNYETECDQNSTLSEFKNINNNNIICDIKDSKYSLSQEEAKKQEIEKIDSHIKNEIPDLLKTISKNNNNNIELNNYDSNYSDTDIENNFHAKDIIGDFNKEIEDEIKQLLNYNINIQDDLEELRKDIKETFAKPIETTINNISDVVNHVIKRLVETQTDVYDQCDDKYTENNECNEKIIEIYNINKENEKNTRTEMNLSRPTFLLLDSSSNTTIADAFLSDGKDEINVYDSEYDTEKLSTNVENTIKQLSTELRKIIPKLDEMREHDKFWTTSRKDSIVTDSNSNEIASSSKCFDCPFTANNSKNKSLNDINAINNSVKVTIEHRPAKERQKDIKYSKKCLRNSQSTSPSVRNENSSDRDCDLESFDVYNIETALPKLDLDAIEHHIKAAKEAERRKRNDREEIRRRLAMGADAEEYYSLGHTDRPGKKPSLHSRLQNGTKLRPTSLTNKPKTRSSHSMGHIELKESDFYALQATLQTEARIALAQAKEMARIQMERERRGRPVSPVTEMLRRSMEKANAPLAADRRRVSRQLLTDMNIAQLQVIVNELHSQIESLNDSLVKLLMARDELHMGQDSMLVDIEDLTRYLGVKEQTKKTKGTTKSGVRRLTSLVHK